MKARWYISALVIILTVLGITNQEQFTAPNQEIVFHFASVKKTSEDAQVEIITTVKEQLQSTGAKNISINESEGLYKITYYSSADVSSIKKVLSEEEGLEVDFNSKKSQKDFPVEPSEDNSIAYNLDIYEISDSNNSESGLGGKYIVEFKPATVRFYISDVYIPHNNLSLKEKNNTDKVAYNFNRNIRIAIADALRYVPEVRAGPSPMGQHS